MSDVDLLALRNLLSADDDAEPGHLMSNRGLEWRLEILDCSQRLQILS